VRLPAKLRPALPALIVLLCTVSTSSHAHIPLIAEDELVIERPKISAAVYGTLEDREQHYVVHLSYDEPFALPFEMLVPRRAELVDHRPAFAVVGPGLPPPTAEEAALLPRAVPEGEGLFLDRNDDPERLLIFESFTRRVFWSSTPVAVALPAGDFEVWVFSPTGSTGDFVLGFGVEEDFSGASCGTLFEDWSTYAY
jgi:hypothetical protein